MPKTLRVGVPDAHGPFEWLILPLPSAPWVEALEPRLPRVLPPSFRSLVMRYAFPSFDIGPVHIFANTGHSEVTEEWATRIFADRILAEALLKNGYTQIGLATGALYDPVCFDTNKRSGGGEYPLVRLDHEAALQFGRVRVIQQVAPSFLDLLGREEQA